MADTCGLYEDVDKTIIKKGYVRSKRKFPIGKSWKKKLMVLYGPTSNGVSRLVKYSGEKAMEDEEASEEFPITQVVNALRCKLSDGAHMDGITLQMVGRNIKQFLCDSESEATEWLTAIQFELNRNDKLPDGMYRVFLVPSATLNFHGECVIYITIDKVFVYDSERKNITYAEWNITHIRRYGADAKKKQFLIEMGSNNVNGEGIYLFRTVYYDEIHSTLEHSAQHIKTSLRRPVQDGRVHRTQNR